MSTEIDAVEAARLVDAGQALLLDVRNDDEWAAGHAPAATHMPMGALDPAALPADQLVVAVCRSGHRSARATEWLRSAGLDVRNLDGGMMAWEQVGQPVQRDDGSPGFVA